LEVSEQFEKAKEDLDRALLLDPQNPAVRTSHQKLLSTSAILETVSSTDKLKV